MFFANWLVFQLEKVPTDAQNRVVLYKFWRIDGWVMGGGDGRAGKIEKNHVF